MQAARETRNAAPDGNVAVARVRCPVRTLVRRAHEQAVARESLAGLLTSTEPPRASTSMKDFTPEGEARRASFEFWLVFTTCVDTAKGQKKVLSQAPHGGGMADGRGRHRRTDRRTLLEQSAIHRADDREEVYSKISLKTSDHKT